MIKERKHKILDHPYVGCALLPVIAYIGLQLLSFMPGFFLGLFGMKSGVFHNVMVAILEIVLVFVMMLFYKYWFQYRFRGCFIDEGIEYGLSIVMAPTVFFVALNVISLLFQGHITAPIYAIIMGCSPGIAEEVMFRGFGLSNAMRKVETKKEMVICVIISAAVFGCIHFVNLLVGAGFILTLGQVFYAFGLGLIYGLAYVCSGSLIPCAIAHSLIDVSAYLGTSISDSSGILQQTNLESTIVSSIISVILGLICIGFCIFVIQKMDVENIKDTWKRIWR